MADEKVNIEILIKNAKASKNVKDLQNSIDALNNELDNTEGLSNDAFFGMVSAVEEANDSMKALVLETKNAELTLTQLEQKQQLLSDSLKGTQRGTQEFENLRLELVQVNKEIGNAELGLVGLNREDVAGAVGQLTGAVGSLSSAFILLGGESGGTIEAIGENIQTAIGITEGFKGAVEGVSAVRKIWQNYQAVIKKSAIATKIMAGAQAILNAVMKLNPVFLLITAFTLLIGLFVVFASGTNKAEKEAKRLNTVLEAQAEAYENLTKQLDEVDRRRQTELANSKKLLISEKKLLESKGQLSKAEKTRFEELDKLINNVDISSLDSTIETTAQKFGGLAGQLQNTFKSIEQSIKATDFEDGVNDINYDEFRKTNAELSKELGDVLSKGFTKENADEQIKNLDRISKAQNEYNALLVRAGSLLGTAEKEVFDSAIEQGKNLSGLLGELTGQASKYNETFQSKDVLTRLQEEEAQIEKNNKATERRAKFREEEARRINELQQLREEIFQKELATTEAVTLRKAQLEFEANIERVKKLVKDEEELSKLLIQVQDQYKQEIEKINKEIIEGVEAETEARKKAIQDIENLNNTTLDNIKILESEKALIQADAIEDEIEREKEKNRILKELDKARLDQLKTNRDIQLQDENLSKNQRIEIEKQYLLDVAKITAEGRQRETEKVLTSLEEEEDFKKLLREAGFEVAQMLADASFEILAENRAKEQEKELDQLSAKLEAERVQLDNQVQLGLKTQRQADREKEKLDKERIKAEEKIKKEAFEKDKKASISQAIINGALALMKVFANVPFPASVVVAGVQAISTGVQLATIQNQQFAKGGIFEGPAHSEGGIKTPFGEVEGGEAVINKNSTKLFKNELSAINQAGGGVKFSHGGVLGSQSVSSENGSGLTETMQKLNETLARPIRSYVVETEITTAQNNVQQLGRNADI